jgi:predicted MFS family arabinose efflux permease
LTLRLPSRAGAGQQGRFDGPGLILLIAFIAPLLIALEQVQQLDPAAFTRILALAVLSIIALALLIWRERRASFPLLPIALLRQPTVWRTNALAACHGAALVSLTAFIPIFLRVTRGASAAESGMLLLPVTIGIGIGSVITGRLVTRTGRTAMFPSYGLMVTTAMMTLIAFLAPRLSTAQLAAALAVTTAFMGTTMTVVQVTIQNAAGRQNLGAAAASVQLSRSIGAALGTAIVGAVLFTALTAGGEASRLFGSMMQLGPAALSGLPTHEQLTLEALVTGAFRAAFLTIAGLAGAGMLFAWSIPIRRI